MHGVTGKPPRAAQDNGALATSRTMLLLLVAMTGVAPISLYLLVPALPVLASSFGRDISIAQMTVSLYMVDIAYSQIIMGPLSDRFGRRPVLLAGLGLMVAASAGCMSTRPPRSGSTPRPRRCRFRRPRIETSFRGASKTRTSDVRLHIGESRDSGSGPEPVIGRRKAPTRWDHPGMTGLIVRLARRPFF
jgi:hypothetical protein